MHPTLRRTNGSWTTPLRAIFGHAVVAGILILAAGCDKQAAPVRRATLSSLAGKPTTLFLLFGDRSDPRLLPVGLVSSGKIAPITLDSAGWHAFDNTYFGAGSPVSLYKDGLATTPATVRRGMWTDSDVLYKLPGCHSLRPLAAVSMPAGDANAGPTVEMLASSAPFPAAPVRSVPSAEDLDSATAFAARAAQRAGLTKSERDELELRVQAIPTGATTRPTLVVAYSEKGSTGGASGRQVFGLADFGVDSYAGTYSHVASDSAPEFRRVIDHLDLTGDGMDEIILEGWGDRSESFLVVLQFTGGKWREVARSTSSWCADEKSAG